MTRWLSHRNVWVTGVSSEAFGDEADDFDFVLHGEVQFLEHILFTPHRSYSSHIIKPMLDCARREAFNPVVIESDKLELPAPLLVLPDDHIIQFFNLRILVLKVMRRDPHAYLWALWV